LTLIRENLDLGRPDEVRLIFDRRITRRTPGRMRTRILTQGGLLPGIRKRPYPINKGSGWPRPVSVVAGSQRHERAG
jgi:hypothetical protein